MEEKLKEAIARASEGKLDAEHLEIVDNLRQLPPVMLETARRLRTRIRIAQFLKTVVPSSSLGEINKFIEEVVDSPSATALEWRARFVVATSGGLNDMARWEPGWFCGLFRRFDSPWFIFEPRYENWLLGGRSGSLFKVIAFDDPQREELLPPLRAYPLPPDSFRLVKEDEACEYLARWIVASICRHLTPGLPSEVETTLRQSGALSVNEVTPFFAGCCLIATAELSLCTEGEVPGYAGPPDCYRSVCSQA